MHFSKQLIQHAIKTITRFLDSDLKTSEIVLNNFITAKTNDPNAIEPK